MSSIPTYIENKKNPAKIKYVDKSLEPILSVTYGCLVYQEQVMQIVRDLAGYTYGRSDLVRRAMSKKKRDVMEEEQKYFIYGKDDADGNVEVMGCIRNGISERAATEIFNQMVSFAEYAFNKSHAAAYAVIAYETGYLKAYYPVEFMAALMTSVVGDSAQIAKYIRNCNEMGIEVLPPSVLDSSKKFTVKEGKIRFGLLGVKNVGEGVIVAIENMRKEKGVPKDIFQFVENVDIHEMNKKAMESLIRAGAFDSLNENRAQHMAVYEGLIESAQNNYRKNIEGQISLFQISSEAMEFGGMTGRLPDVANFTSDILISMEKEMLGVYLTGHPLKDYADKIEKLATVTSEELMHAETNEEITDGMKVVVAGIINSKKTLVTKSNKMMAFVDIEDLYGIVEVLVFPNIYERYSQYIKDDAVIAVSGSINFKEDEAPKLIADRIFDLNSLPEGQPIPINSFSKQRQFVNHVLDYENIVKLKLPEGITVDMVTDILVEHKGEIPVILYVAGKTLKTNEGLWVDPTTEFKLKMETLLGRKNVKA